MTVAIDGICDSQVLNYLGRELKLLIDDACGLGPPQRIWEQALFEPLADFLSRPGKSIRAGLVEACWELAGSKRALPVELPLIVEILHAGSLIIDDIEDGSTERRGTASLHERFGLPTALNAGNWLYFWPQVMLERMEFPPAIELAMHRAIARTMLKAHSGQALDLGAKVHDLEPSAIGDVVRETTRLKTAALMELSAVLGATAARAQPRRIEILARFGNTFGVALQMLDDASSLLAASRRHKGLEDILLGRATWVWAWAAEEQSLAELRELQRLSAATVAGLASVGELSDRLYPFAKLGRQRAADAVRGALSEVVRDLGSCPAIQTLWHQVEGLERSYV